MTTLLARLLPRPRIEQPAPTPEPVDLDANLAARWY